MPEARAAWIPTTKSRLGFLRSELATHTDEQVEVAIPDMPVPCHLGLRIDGSASVRVACEPETVSVDDLTSAVRFVVRKDGYRIEVAATAVESVAAHFLDEVLKLVRNGHEAGDAGRAALQNWRELLARPAGVPLSEKSLVGLFGELEVLEAVLRHGGRLDHWTGWNKDHADFRLPRLVIEVKSTSSANYRRVRIHGLGQLADPEDGSGLVLVLRRLELSPEGRSVPDLTDDIVRLGASRATLLDRLSQMSYSEQHRPQYEELRFVSKEVALRRIDDDHPRLVPSMLKAVDLSSIDKIDYELNLNGDAEADLDTTLDSLIAAHAGSA